MYQVNEYVEQCLDLKGEICKLRVLLKECYNMLAQYQVENSEPSLNENIHLLTKIDEVFNEHIHSKQ